MNAPVPLPQRFAVTERSPGAFPTTVLLRSPLEQDGARSIPSESDIALAAAALSDLSAGDEIGSLAYEPQHFIRRRQTQHAPVFAIVGAGKAWEDAYVEEARRFLIEAFEERNRAFKSYACWKGVVEDQRKQLTRLTRSELSHYLVNTPGFDVRRLWSAADRAAAEYRARHAKSDHETPAASSHMPVENDDTQERLRQ